MNENELRTPPSEADVADLLHSLRVDGWGFEVGIVRRLLSQVAALASERDAAHGRGREEGIELAREAAVLEATHRRELARVAGSEAGRCYLHARAAGAWDTIDAIDRLRSFARAGGEG